MNILRALCLASFVFNSMSYISITCNKKNCILYMKKTKLTKGPLYKPKNINQDKYVSHLNNYNTKILISTGPAGCGKTLFACQKAVLDLLSSSINKIIITRPIVSVDEEIGFLPGNIIKKMEEELCKCEPNNDEYYENQMEQVDGGGYFSKRRKSHKRRKNKKKRTRRKSLKKLF